MATYQPYSYNNNNNNGGDYNNGGGFQQTSNYQSNGGFQESSQGKSQQRNTITPVTIKQINESSQLVPDGEFTINNVELNTVSFVGVIRNIVDNTSSLNITVEDGTGTIDIRKWNDDSSAEGEPSNSAAEYPLGTYVFVTGSLKEFNGKKNLQYATVKQITDHNEVIYHHLSAIAVHLQAQGLSSNDASSNGNNLFVSNPASSEAPKSNVDKIFDFIHEQTPSMPEGVPIQLISQTLGIMVEDVQLHTAKLTEDGRIYHGYDDNGFLAV